MRGWSFDCEAGVCVDNYWAGGLAIISRQAASVFYWVHQAGDTGRTIWASDRRFPPTTRSAGERERGDKAGDGYLRSRQMAEHRLDYLLQEECSQHSWELKTIMKNLSCSLTHCECPVINTFSASQNWREHNFVQTLPRFSGSQIISVFLLEFSQFEITNYQDHWLTESYYFISAGAACLQCHKWDDLITPFPGPQTISTYRTVLIVWIPSLGPWERSSVVWYENDSIGVAITGAGRSWLTNYRNNIFRSGHGHLLPSQR